MITANVSGRLAFDAREIQTKRRIKMTVKRRVKKLEDELGGTSNMHYLIVFGGGNESREAALERTLKAKDLTIENVGRVSYIAFDTGPDEVIYHPEIPRKDLIGGDALKEIIKGASVNITLNPPNVDVEATA